MAHKLFTLLCILITLGVAACGVKPKHLSAPEGADATAYPKTYPTAK